MSRRHAWRELAWLWVVLPSLAGATTWYWRPNNMAYGDESGSSYRDAWRIETQIKWEAMQDGDILLICGRHDTGYLDRGLVTGRGHITISGRCRDDPGEIVSAGTRFRPQDWSGPDANGVFTVAYSGSPGSAADDMGQLQLLTSVPSAASPCRSFFHAANVLYYRPCGPLQTVYPAGMSPVVGIRHDGVTLEYLGIRNGGSGVGVMNATGVNLRHLNIRNHTGIGIALTGRTGDGKIQFNEIHDVTDGIYAIAGGGEKDTDRHDRWLVEGNVIHDIQGSGDAHGIGWQSGSDNVLRRNYILRAAGSGIVIYAWRYAENSRNLIEDNVIVDVVQRSVEQWQGGIGLTGDSCWSSLDNRRGDIVRNNIIENVAEGIYAKAGPTVDGRYGVLIEGNRVRARQTGIRWANPNGGRAPDLPMRNNEIDAPRALQPVSASALSCAGR